MELHHSFFPCEMVFILILSGMSTPELLLWTRISQFVESQSRSTKWCKASCSLFLARNFIPISDHERLDLGQQSPVGNKDFAKRGGLEFLPLVFFFCVLHDEEAEGSLNPRYHVGCVRNPWRRRECSRSVFYFSNPSLCLQKVAQSSVFPPHSVAMTQSDARRDDRDQRPLPQKLQIVSFVGLLKPSCIQQMLAFVLFFQSVCFLSFRDYLTNGYHAIGLWSMQIQCYFRRVLQFIIFHFCQRCRIVYL